MNPSQITAKIWEWQITELWNNMVQVIIDTFMVVKTLFVPLFTVVMPWFIGLGLLLGVLYVIIGKIKGRGV